MVTRKARGKRERLNTKSTTVGFSLTDGVLVERVARQMGLSRHTFVRMAAVRAARAEEKGQEVGALAQAS